MGVRVRGVEGGGLGGGVVGVCGGGRVVICGGRVVVGWRRVVVCRGRRVASSRRLRPVPRSCRLLLLVMGWTRIHFSKKKIK